MNEQNYKKIIAIGGLCFTIALGGLYLQNKKISRLEKEIYSMEKEVTSHYGNVRGIDRPFYVINGDTLVKLPKPDIKEKPYHPKPDNRLRWHSKDAENYLKNNK